MIPLKTQATLVRLSRSSINIAKRTSREPPPRTVISVFCQKRTFISIVNPDAPRIVKIRKSALPKSDTGVESEKVLSLRQFLSVPKPVTEKIDTNISSDDVHKVAKSNDEVIQLTTEERTDHENPEKNTENTEHKHDVPENNNRKEEVIDGNVLKDDINDETLHQKEEAPVVETNSSLGDRKQEEVEEKVNKVVEEINKEEDTVSETLYQNEAPVEETRSSIAADEEVEVKETKVTEETDKEAVKEEQSLSVSQEENVTQNEEDLESDDESDSSSDSELSSSSSSSSSDSESEDRDDVGRKRLDQVKRHKRI